jgi:DNA-binding NtrC family response regulator
MSKILLIDDDEQVLKSLGMLLESEGHEVTSIRDPEKAEEAVRQEDCDLLITDVRMSPVDGIQLLRVAREAKPDVPTIVISAYTSEQTLKESMQFGCSAYIKKPFQIEEVLDAVKTALGK